MKIDENPIGEFVKKHKMDWRDEWMQVGVVLEEAKELREASLQYGGHTVKEEAADVIIAIMVLAASKGWLTELPELVAKKMEENLKKPVGRKAGEKVMKA